MKRSHIPEPRGDSGFTLLELLIVIVVLGILAGIAILAVASFRSDASAAGCVHDRRALQSALAAYQGQHAGAYPASLDLLETGTPQYLQGNHISGDDYTGDGYTLNFDRASETISPCQLTGASAGPTASASPAAPITVLGCNPSSLGPGPAQILTVSGTGFNAADADVSIPGLASANVQSRTTTSLTVKLTVPTSAATGPRDVTVSSAADGLSGTKVGCFDIT